MLNDKYVFEVGIYRQSEESFRAEYERNKKKHMDWQSARPGMMPGLPELQERIELRFSKDYPCPWRYNNLIVYIHVFFLWEQIRGDLWMADGLLEGRRYDRRSKKVFREMGKAFEMLIFDDQDNADLGRGIREHLIAAGKGLRQGKGAYVETEAFDNLSPHVDWRGLIADLSRSSR